MNRTIKLLGTYLQLNKGQAVYIKPAINIPSQHGWFAWPIDKWPDGIERSSEDSILVTDKDFTPIGD